jgi:hypothetical protein
MFYTYAHTRNDTNKIFYIGKGKNKQAWRKQDRNQYWQRIVKKYGHTIEILANWDTEQQAFDHEILLISCFKDMGYELVNLTDGGEGMSNPSVETRIKLSKARMGSKNPFFGKTHSDEVKAKMSKDRLGKKLSAETKAKISTAQLGNKHSNFKGVVIATNINTKEVLELLGGIDMTSKGFIPSKICLCLSGKRKSHKGFTFKRLEK